MLKEKFQEYLYRPESYQQADLSEMEQLISEYPWFSTAAILLLLCSKSQSVPDFDLKLKKYIIQIPSRKQLQIVLQSVGVCNAESRNPQKIDSSEPEEEENQTDEADFKTGINGPSVLDDESLLDFSYHPPKHGFLVRSEKPSEDTEISAVDDDNEVTSDPKVSSVENSSNFDRWISKLDGEPVVHKKHEIIESFIQSEPGVIRADKETQLQGDIAKNSAEEHDGFITDTLAKIYLKQGLYNKAIYAYEKLCLKYPEKSIYFATQIEEIKRLYIKN